MTANDPTADFVTLWTAHSRKVYAFILSLLPHWADADEAFQETGRVLWEKFSEYRSGSDFPAWACRIAYLNAVELRRRKQRSPTLFTDSFLEAIDQGFVEATGALEARHVALIECMKKLKEHDLHLIRARYKDGASTATVATESGRSTNAIYKALNRIHESLFQCIERAFRKERT